MDSYKTITRAELYIDKLFDQYKLDLIAKTLSKIAYTKQVDLNEIKNVLMIHLMSNPSMIEIPARRCVNYKFGIGFAKLYSSTNNEEYKPGCKYFIKRYVDLKGASEECIRELDKLLPNLDGRIELTSNRFNDYFNSVGDLLFERFSKTL